MYEDTYRVRQLNEMKVQHEMQTIDLLNKCLIESDDNTHRMRNLLDNFESRLNGLHDLIVPIYDATNTLQIKHSSKNLELSNFENKEIIIWLYVYFLYGLMPLFNNNFDTVPNGCKKYHLVYGFLIPNSASLMRTFFK